MSKPATIDEYINTAPPLGHALLNELRTLCRDAAPDAVEQIKWGQPAYVHPDGVGSAPGSVDSWGLDCHAAVASDW